jgi:hypothetical protein
MLADSLLGRFDIGIIAVIQYHGSDVAKDSLNWVIVRTAFRQTDPMQLEGSHGAAGVMGFTGMGPILVQYNPHGLSFVPMPDPLHETADIH